MQNPETMRAILAAGAGPAIMVLIAAVVISIASQAMASADIAKKTGQPCAKCHTTPPALNDYGKNYKK